MKLQAFDHKWSERLSHLGALRNEKPISQPAFQQVKVSPVKQPPAGAILSDQPFLSPTSQTVTDQAPVLEK